MLPFLLAKLYIAFKLFLENLSARFLKSSSQNGARGLGIRHQAMVDSLSIENECHTITCKRPKKVRL